MALCCPLVAVKLLNLSDKSFKSSEVNKPGIQSLYFFSKSAELTKTDQKVTLRLSFHLKKGPNPLSVLLLHNFTQVPPPAHPRTRTHIKVNVKP